MRHFLFLYFILVYTVGFAALIVIVMLYVRSRIGSVLAYAIFYFAFTLKVVLSGLNVYASLNMLDAGILPAVNIVDSWTTLFFSCTIVSLMRHLFESPRLRPIEWGFYAAAIALFLYSAVPGSLLSGPAYLLLAAASLYSLIVSIVFMKESQALLRGAARILIIGLGVFTPLIFLPIFFVDSLPPFLRETPLQLVTFPLFYCYHGVLFAHNFFRYAHSNAHPPGQGESAEWLRRGGHGLSPREMEVIELVGSGESNKMIGEKLFISLPTVKKHLHNIYGKLGISTRYQLIHRLKQPRY